MAPVGRSTSLTSRREIVGQTLMMAARDRLGWSAREVVLREASADEKRESAARLLFSM